MAAERSWADVVGTGWEWLRGWFARAVRVYLAAFVVLVLAALFLVMLGVGFNKSGAPAANYVLAAVFLVAWAFVTFYPGTLLAAFGLGVPKGLPKDWSLNQLIREAKLPDLQMSAVVSEGLNTLRTMVKLSSHLALFVTVVFVVLGTWRIENAGVVLPVFVILVGIGFWSALFKRGAVWYARVTITVLLVALAMMLYGGYVYLHPQDTTVGEIDRVLTINEDKVKQRTAKELLAKAKAGNLTDADKQQLATLKKEQNGRGLRGVAQLALDAKDDLFYERKVEYEVVDFAPNKVSVCGIRAGKRTFSVPYPVRMMIGPENYQVDSYLRINGATAGESFKVDDPRGCVLVTFAFGSAGVDLKPGSKQIIPIVFE